ncbi:MAG: RNA 2',3'-cyclic phosphodiesterase [Beijerinckiaceae bacterium]|nr:RNA 2',3'-cyclic phosphodiesterase [Beijerinckiaceae bacterium]MDO9439276.1 RNA 2',3'-cyclic phosphodiesterase [Beijerinckiaceae bacterium]
MPRLFTGFEIPPDLSFELSLMRGGISGARWIDAENYHVTLRFIGDVDHAMARDISSSLDLIRRDRCEIRIDGLASFGGDKPRAIVARVQPTAPLVDLQAEQERLMRRLGLPPEPRKFTPHVTLARLRSTGALEVADYLGMRGLFHTRTFTPQRFVLYSARDSVGGGPYVVEAAYQLG